jgi:hypothetical protein
MDGWMTDTMVMHRRALTTGCFDQCIVACSSLYIPLSYRLPIDEMRCIEWKDT